MAEYAGERFHVDIVLERQRRECMSEIMETNLRKRIVDCFDRM